MTSIKWYHYNNQEFFFIVKRGVFFFARYRFRSFLFSLFFKKLLCISFGRGDSSLNKYRGPEPLGSLVPFQLVLSNTS